MDALSEAIVRLLRRQEETERRLAAIEESLRGGAELNSQAKNQPAPQQREKPCEAVPIQPEPFVKATPSAPTEPPRIPKGATNHQDSARAQQERPHAFETQIGLTWISRIGAITLVFAAAFIFKYAIDNQWIGEAGRVALGVAAGLLTIGIGDRIWTSGQKIYSQAISALGVAILYLAFYASFGFYHVLSQSLAFVMMALITALGGALALRYGAPAMAALALIGGYLTPLLVSTGEDHPIFYFGYIVLLDLGAAALVRVRKWLGLELLAFCATALLYAVWFADRFSAGKETVATIFALLFYVLFLIAEQPVVVIAAQALGALVMAFIWPSNALSYLALGTAIGAAGLGTADRRKIPLLPIVAVAGFWWSYASWPGAHATPPPVGSVLLLLTVAFLLFFTWLPWRALSRRVGHAGHMELHSGDFLIAVTNAAAYYAAAYSVLVNDHHSLLGLFTVGVAIPYLGLSVALRRRQEISDPRSISFSLGIALTLLTLAVPIQFAGFRITIVWAVEGAALIWIAQRTGTRRLIFAALAVFTLALIRLWTIDSWIYPHAADYSTLVNARFLTFLASAASLWASAHWSRDRSTSLTLYLAGHVVMIWGAGLEVVGWAERTAAPQNVGNLERLSISVLMSLYALLLVIVGVISRTMINRVLGLGLIGIVVIKLYLYDVWLLGRIYRIAAFGALGASLLVTSYLYSRYRTKIEAWWRDEKTVP